MIEGRADTKVFAGGGFGHDEVRVLGSGDGVVGLGGALLD